MEYESVRRTPRYSLAVEIEITDMGSGTLVSGRSKMLSLSGCCLDSVKLLPQGTAVRIKLSHRGSEVTVLAKVVYSNPDLGMGVAFTSFEPEDQRILECWIAKM